MRVRPLDTSCSRLQFLTLQLTGTLKLRALERIVIDGSHIDQKKRGIFDMKDTHLALLKLLTRTELKERYTAKQKPLKILVF